MTMPDSGLASEQGPEARAQVRGLSNVSQSRNERTVAVEQQQGYVRYIVAAREGSSAVGVNVRDSELNLVAKFIIEREKAGIVRRRLVIRWDLMASSRRKSCRYQLR